MSPRAAENMSKHPTATSRRAAGPPDQASSRRPGANGRSPGVLRTAPSRKAQEFRKRLLYYAIHEALVVPRLKIYRPKYSSLGKTKAIPQDASKPPFKTMDRHLALMRLPQQLSAFVLSAFGVLALALAAVGSTGWSATASPGGRARSASARRSAPTAPASCGCSLQAASRRRIWRR